MNLFDIIQREKWQKMQEGFSNALGICIQTVDLNGVPIPGINIPSTFCIDIIRRSHKSVTAYHSECIPKLIAKIKKDKSENYRICSFGAYLYGIPIGLKEEGDLAYIIVGPVLLQKKKNENLWERVEKENAIDTDYLSDRMSTLKRFTFAGIESTVELLREVAQYIAQLNYETKKLKRRFHTPKQLDDLIKDLYLSVYVQELLNALLEASLNTTRGDAGSIMLLDHDKDELEVKFSSGLDADVIKKAKVRIGEGISGIVAKDREPLLIDGSSDDPKIKDRLKRPHIKSSIVYPLEVKNRVFGVMNLNSTDKETNFDSDTLNLVGNLARLTKVALAMFPHKID